MKHGTRIYGHFNELLGDGPIVWPDEPGHTQPIKPKLFNIPTPGQPPESMEARRLRIGRDLAAAQRKADAAKAQAPKHSFFNIPKKGK